MYNKILIAVAPGHADLAPEMITAARCLAAEGAEIKALSVSEQIPNYVLAEVPSDLVDASRMEIERELAGAVGDATDITTEVQVGHAARSIVDEAENGYDLIVLRSHKPGFQDWLIGSTAGKVVQHAPCSVHVIR